MGSRTGDVSRGAAKAGGRSPATEPQESPSIARLAVTALDASDRATLVRDADGRVLYANRTASDVYALKPEQLLGHTCDDVLQTTYPESRASVDRALAAEGAWEGPVLHVRGDGRPLVVISHQVLRRGDTGEPAAILQFDRVPSSWSEAHTLVPGADPADEQVYLFEAIREPGGRLADVRLRFVGEESRLQQPGIAEAVGRASAEWYPGFRESSLLRVMERVLDSRERTSFADVRLQPPWADHELIVTGLVVPFGPDGVAVRARDVTVERRALQALDDAQARVRLALAASPVAIVRPTR